jgi:hypothetical protein
MYNGVSVLTKNSNDNLRTKTLKHVNVTTPFCQCCGSVIFIPDSGCEIFKKYRIPDLKDPGSASKNLRIFNPKNCFQAIGNRYLPDQGCSSRIADPVFSSSRIPDPDPGVKKTPDPGSATRVFFTLFLDDNLP